MKRGTLFGREVRLQGSPWTLLEYWEAFGGDITADFIATIKDPEIDVEFYMRAAWAMAKTLDDDTADYIDWLMEFPSINCETEEEAEKLRITQTYEAVDFIIGAIRAELLVEERPCPRTPSDEPDENPDADSEGTDEQNDPADRRWVPYTNILALIRLGFSIDEIRHMTMRRFITFTDLVSDKYNGTENTATEGGTREATQADIDRFFG